MKITKTELFRLLDGKASAFEKRDIRKWMQEDVANVEFYYQCLEEWESLHSIYAPTQDDAFEKFSMLVDGQQVPETAPSQKVSRIGGFRMPPVKWMAGAAAVLALLITLSQSEFAKYRHYTTGNGEVKTIVLPDNSVIVLNANTDLKMSRWGFLQKTRIVYLQGEAVFNVVHTHDNRPFVVKGESGEQVQVLGTEFDMYSRNHASRVTLNKGSIRLRLNENSSAAIMMKPGDKVSAAPHKKAEIRKNQSFRNISAWKEHRFVFDATPLSDITTMLEDQFGKQIIIENPELRTRKVSGSYKWEKEEDFLSTLALMMQFTAISKEDKTIIK